MTASNHEKTKTNTTEPATDVHTDATCTRVLTHPHIYRKLIARKNRKKKKETHVRHAHTLCNLCSEENKKLVIDTEMYNKLIL